MSSLIIYKMDIYNATVEMHRSDDQSAIFRVYPDFPIRLFGAGQYGSLGLLSDRSENKLVKRAYSISSSIIDLQSKELINQRELKYLEFYINKVKKSNNKEQITPKLFKLKSGDRLFCGEKIVGHYTFHKENKWENIVLISTHTGESPNNSITNQLLLDKSKLNITNINVGHNWESLYLQEHKLLEKLFPNYTFIQFVDDTLNYEIFTDLINKIDHSKNKNYSNLDFKINKDKTLVMICGDPVLIGAPIKKGGWEYEYPDYGIVNVLTNKSFVMSTRFKKGNIICESYW